MTDMVWDNPIMQGLVRQLKILNHAKSVEAGHLLHRRNIYVPGFHEKPSDETHWQFGYAPDNQKDLYYFYVPKEMSEVEAYKATKEYVKIFREAMTLEHEIHNKTLDIVLHDVDDRDE